MNAPQVTELQLLGLIISRYKLPFVWLNIKSEGGHSADVNVETTAANDVEG